MNIIKDDCFVEIDFVLKTIRDEVLDSSKDEGPLKYIHGKKRISPLLEKELTGRKLGEEFKVNVRPEDGYGVRDEDKIRFVEKKMFGDNFSKITIGMPLEMESPSGETGVAMAVDIKEDGIVLDGNHPLAGESLTYEIKVLSIREATSKELSD